MLSNPPSTQTAREDLFGLLRKPTTVARAADEPDGLKQSAVQELQQNNPVSRLSPAEYETLLALLVGCHRFARGRLMQKTHIELAAWLEVLRGQKTVQEHRSRFDRLWGWESLAQLNCEPLLACVYMRMVEDRSQ